jgi:hypothetical protein
MHRAWVCVDEQGGVGFAWRGRQNPKVAWRTCAHQHAGPAPLTQHPSTQHPIARSPPPARCPLCVQCAG